MDVSPEGCRGASRENRGHSTWKQEKRLCWGDTEMEARAAGVACNRLFIVAWTPRGSRLSPPTKFSGPSREKNTARDTR